MKKAVVLLSGGLDSATTLYLARQQGFKCLCLVFDYGQSHKREIESAKKIAKRAHSPWQIIKINFPWKGSALLDDAVKIPQSAQAPKRPSVREIPATYVPGRNIIFLSLALSCAEAIQAKAIFIGAHAQDYSGYPDCRPDFLRAFNKVAAKGTKAGVEGEPITVIAPLLYKTKAQIIRLGMRLGVPFALTWSCYNGKKSPCGTCDSCYYRAKGFREAGIIDPLIRGTLIR